VERIVFFFLLGDFGRRTHWHVFSVDFVLPGGLRVGWWNLEGRFLILRTYVALYIDRYTHTYMQYRSCAFWFWLHGWRREGCMSVSRTMGILGRGDVEKS
jgi:hypothetical protein